MEVTEISIRKMKPDKGLIAFATIILDNQMRLNSIAVHHKKYSSKEYRITYPFKESGSFVFQMYQSICAKLGHKIEESICNEMKKVTNENDRYNNNNSGLKKI